MHFTVYQDKANGWRWTLYADNGRKIADSGEAYVEKAGARHVGLNIASLPDDGSNPYKCNTQSTTFVIGHLCGHTFSSTIYHEFEGYRGAPLQQIWPMQKAEIRWPPLGGISGPQAIDLAEAIAASLPGPPPHW